MFIIKYNNFNRNYYNFKKISNPSLFKNYYNLTKINVFNTTKIF